MQHKPQPRHGHQAKAKTKASHSRLYIGGGVLIALVAIVVIKLASQASASGGYRVVSAPATAQAVQSVGFGPQPAPAVAQAAAAPTSASPVADPYPVRPAAQIGWIQRNQKPAMVLFHSKTCIPCKQMEALVSQVRADYEPDVVFIDVLTDDRTNLDLVRQAGIQAIPTTFFYTRNGEGKRAVGALKEDALRAELDALRSGGS